MNKAQIKVVWNRRNEKIEENAQAAIHIYVYKKPDIRKYIHTGIFVTKDQFCDDKGKIVKHNRNVELNRIISEKIRSIEDYEFSLLQNGKELSSDTLDFFINNEKNPGISFLDYYSKEILGKDYKHGTYKELNYTLNVLKEYKEKIRFDEIDYNFVVGFDDYLVKNGLKLNTRSKHHGHINKFLNLASLQKVYKGDNPYKIFKIKKIKGDRVNLSVSELQAIEQLEIMPIYNEVIFVRKLFLFSCYTGLRFSDIVSLTYSNVKVIGDEIYISKKLEKTKDNSQKSVNLPLHLLFNGKPKEIFMEFYNSDKLDNESVFPFISNQHINRLLKILAQMSGVNARLTFHMARHTFGTFLAELTQNPYLIMDLMGHADIQTSMIYIHRSQERINKQLRNVNWLM